MRQGLAKTSARGRFAARVLVLATRGAASRFESCGGVQPLEADYHGGCRWGVAGAKPISGNTSRERAGS